MQTTTSLGGLLLEHDAGEAAEPRHRLAPWVALCFLALFQAGTLANGLIGVEEQARRVGFWALAEILVIALWWTGRSQHVVPVVLVFCLEALKVACEKWAVDVGELRTTVAVLLVTAAQVGLLVVTLSPWFSVRPRARSFGIQLLFGISAFYAGAVLFNMLIREVVRQ